MMYPEQQLVADFRHNDGQQVRRHDEDARSKKIENWSYQH